MEKQVERILIIDDHDVVLKGLRQIAEETLGNSCAVDGATSGYEAIELAQRTDYDLCLVDIELPDIDGIRLLRALKAVRPEMKQIVNTIHEEIWFMKSYLDAGVDGVLFKDVNAAEIALAIRRVLDGGSYLCSRARDIKRTIDGFDPPTPRELDVLLLLAEGESTERIASTLALSVNTIESHRRHLLDKLGARNSAELIMIAVKSGLIPISKR